MVDVQNVGVQEVSSIAGEAGKAVKRQAGQAIQGIAYQGMADGCQMDSDLMRTARIEAYLKRCGSGGA